MAQVDVFFFFFFSPTGSGLRTIGNVVGRQNRQFKDLLRNFFSSSFPVSLVETGKFMREYHMRCAPEWWQKLFEICDAWGGRAYYY